MAAVHACPHCGTPIAAPMVALIEATRFGPVTKAALRLLAKRPGLFHETRRIVDAAYADDPNGGPLGGSHSIRILMFRARVKLAPLGVALTGRGGAGNGAYKLEFMDAA